jgi:hypothetical protein
MVQRAGDGANIALKVPAIGALGKPGLRKRRWGVA